MFTILLASSIPYVAHADTSDPRTCPDTLVLAVDGTKSPRTPTSIDPASPLNRVAETHRRHGTVIEHVEYPGGIIAGVAGWTENYDDSVATGRDRLRTRIAEQERQCASTRYILLGYSQGARIVGDVASEIDTRSDGVRDRTEVFLYADPRQPGTGIEVALAGEKPTRGITFSGERPPFRVVDVRWICHPTDGVCDAREPLGVDTVVGYLSTHTTY